MTREIRRIIDRAKRNYIYFLVSSGRVKKYVNDKGYMCYDPEDVKQYKKHARVGRPIKKEI